MCFLSFLNTNTTSPPPARLDRQLRARVLCSILLFGGILRLWSRWGGSAPTGRRGSCLWCFDLLNVPVIRNSCCAGVITKFVVIKGFPPQCNIQYYLPPLETCVALCEVIATFHWFNKANWGLIELSLMNTCTVHVLYDVWKSWR